VATARIQKELVRTGGTVARTSDDIARVAGDLVTLRAVEQVGGSIEMAPRVAAYRRALGRGASPSRATMEGRRVTLDFGRSGEWVRRANRVTLFLNATVQGGAQLGRLARDSSTARFLVAGLGAAALATYAHNRQYLRADGTPWFSDIPQSVRDTHLVLFVPGTGDEQTMPKYVAWPMRQFALFTGPVYYAAGRMEGRDPRALGEFVNQMFGRTLSPVQGESAGGAIGGMLPAGIGTYLQADTNQNFYGGYPIVSRALSDMDAPEREFDEKTSVTARALSPLATDAAKALRSVPLVGGALASVVDPWRSPKTAEFMVGDLGPLAAQGLALSDRAQGQESAEARLRQSTVGRVWRDKGGQLERDQSERFESEVQRRWTEERAALAQAPDWAALPRDEQDSRLRAARRRIESEILGQMGDDAPEWALSVPETVKVKGQDVVLETVHRREWTKRLDEKTRAKRAALEHDPKYLAADDGGKKKQLEDATTNASTEVADEMKHLLGADTEKPRPVDMPPKFLIETVRPDFRELYPEPADLEVAIAAARKKAIALEKWGKTHPDQREGDPPPDLTPEEEELARKSKGKYAIKQNPEYVAWAKERAETAEEYRTYIDEVGE